MGVASEGKGVTAYGMVIRCHVNSTAVFCDCISMKIFGRKPTMLAASGFAGDVFLDYLACSLLIRRF